MKKIYLLTILVLIALVSCEDFLDVNEDPNAPIEVTPDLILPTGQMYTARYLQHDRGLNHLGNMIMYNWSETFGFSWYDEEFKYLVTTTFYDQLFDDAYTDALKMYADMDELDDDYVYYKAISKIMKAYHYQILVDLFGDVPYSEALQRGANPTPTYDDAAEIYTDLLDQLNEAITMIKGVGDAVVEEPGTDDAMFGGDMDEWVRFANTLKLRILVRQSGVVDITAAVATIEAEGSGYITSDVLVNPGYSNATDRQNPLWVELGWDVGGTVTLSNDATCATQYVLDFLTEKNDPRIDYIYEEPATGHLGVEQGSNPGDDHAADFVSNIGPGILKSADMGANIFSLAESYFLQAEAALLGAGTGNPQALYELGIRASFDYLGLTAADADAYLEQTAVNVDYTQSTPLEAIITQKWIALNGITAEQSWFDYTRTGYPLNLPLSLAASATSRPVRLFYPSSEITGNSTNVPDQPDAFSSKIFWAQ